MTTATKWTLAGLVAALIAYTLKNPAEAEQFLAQLPQDGRSDGGAASATGAIYSPAKLTASQRAMADLIIERAEQAGLDPRFMLVLAATESSLNPDAVGDDGVSLGLFQFTLSTARGFEPAVTREQLFQPELNADLAMRFMRQLMTAYPGRNFGDYAEAWTLGGHGKFDLGRSNTLKRQRMDQHAAQLGVTLDLNEVPA